MTQKKQNQQEEAESFKSYTDLECWVELFDDFVILLHELEKSEEPRDLDQLVQLTYSGNSRKSVDIHLFLFSIYCGRALYLVLCEPVKDDVKGQDREQIYKEPATDVVLSYDSSFVDHFIHLVLVSTIEDDAYV